MAKQNNESEPKGRRVSVDLTPAAAEQVDRLRDVTGLTTADIFRHALAMFRIYVQVRQSGRELVIIDPKNNNVRSQIEFPLVLAGGEDSGV